MLKRSLQEGELQRGVCTCTRRNTYKNDEIAQQSTSVLACSTRRQIPSCLPVESLTFHSVIQMSEGIQIYSATRLTQANSSRRGSRNVLEVR